MATNEKDLTAAVERARKLQASLDSANLNLVNSRQLFDTRAASEDVGLSLALSSGENAGLVDPAMVSSDLSAQLVGYDQSHSSELLIIITSYHVGVLQETEIPIYGA